MQAHNSLSPATIQPPEVAADGCVICPACQLSRYHSRLYELCGRLEDISADWDKAINDELREELRNRLRDTLRDFHILGCEWSKLIARIRDHFWSGEEGGEYGA